MPLTPKQKYDLVVASGLDPTEYTWDEGATTGTDALNPPPPAASPAAMTMSQAAGSRLARSVGPGLLSLPAMAAGGEAGSVFGPVGTVVGALAGGLGGGYIGQKIQEPIFKFFQSPDSYQKGVENYEKAGQKFPKTSVAMDILPQIAAFGPGGLPTMMKGAGKLAMPSKLLAPGLGMAPTLSMAEKTALISGGINSALGTGSEAVKQAVAEPSEQPMDYGRIATAGIGGLLLNKPYGPIGNRLFPSAPIVEPVMPSRPQGLSLEESPAISTHDLPRFTPQELEALDELNQAKKDQLDYQDEFYKGFAGQDQELKQNLKPSKYVQKVDAPEEVRQPSAGTIEDAIYPKPGEAELIKNPTVVDEQRYKNYVEEQSPVPPERQIPEDVGGPKLQGPDSGVELQSPEKGKVRTVNEGTKYYQESEPEALRALKAGEVAAVDEPTISEADRQAARKLATKRGVNLQEPQEIISEVTNQFAKGYSVPLDREAAISDIATRDTGPHEVAGHQYLADLQKSTLESDRNFARRGLEAAGGDQEALADAVGQRAADIQDKPIRSWVEDFWSNTKRLAKFGGNEDDINLFARRALDDRPYSESPELQTKQESGSSIPALRAKLYQEATNEEGQSSKEPSKGLTGLTTSLVDKMIAKGGSDKIAGEAYRDFEKQQVRNTGEITNQFIGAAKKIKDKEAAARYIYDMRVNEGRPSKAISAQDRAIVDNELAPIYRKVHDIQRSEGLLVSGREAKDNPNFRGPLMTNAKTLRILTEHPATSVDRLAAVKQFVDYHVNVAKDASTPAEAKKMLNDYLRAISSGGRGSQGPQFNALRKAEGVGIPWEWMEKDPVKLFQRYGNRVSRDLAFFKHIQNVPEARAAFGIPDQHGSVEANDLVPTATGSEKETALKRITGESTPQANIVSGVEHLVRSLILGPVTGVKNLTNSVSQMLPYLPVKDLPMVAKAFKYISKGLEDGLAKGVIRPSVSDLEVGNTSEGFGRVADLLRTFGDSIRHYSGANYLEQVSRAHTMAVGEIATRAYAGRAAKGDIDAIRFLKQFAPKDFDPRNLTEDMVKETAANLVERVQGTYGGRGLPAFLLEPSSPAYWLMSLSKWSVEKSNAIKQDVFNPALKGDYGPLLRYTLGSLATGELIRTISETMFGKKAQTPNLTELQDKGRVQDWAFKATELMWLASYGGILSDAAKMAGDKLSGQRVRGPSMPSYEIIKDMASDITDAGVALSQGENPVDVTLALVNDILVNNIQALKVAYNHSPFAADEIDRANKFRDKRVYDRMSGKDMGQAPEDYNKYKNLNERQFKQAKTVEEGQKIFEEKLKPKLEGLDKEHRKEEVKALKSNNYEVAPSDWQQSKEYYDYIRRTQGEAAAESLRNDKKNQDRVNRQKGHLVR